MDSAIVVNGLGKSYRRYHPDKPATIQEAVAKGVNKLRSIERTWALRDVSFRVGTGRTVGIVGSNGSGKSTLLRLIGGVGQPDEGTVEIHGRLGALLDLGAGFHPDLTGRENAVLSGILNGLTRREVLERMDSIVAFAEVERAIDNPVRTYSSGMQMRLAFSTAVHTDPEILLIDEVLAVGDVAFQRKCLERISQFKSTGCSILIVSHDAGVIRELCDEALWMNSGHLAAQGPARDVVRQYIKHMEGDTPAFQPRERKPLAAYAPAITYSPRNGEPVHHEDRFGTLEMEITSVRLLDAAGQPITEMATGEPAQVELDFAAAKPVAAPIVQVRISRDDGLICYDLSTKLAELGLAVVEGPGRVRLVLDRLDLNTGRYVIDVGCYARTWAYAYDCQLYAHTFAVRGSSARGALLNVPHHWNASLGPETAVAVQAGGLRP